MEDKEKIVNLISESILFKIKNSDINTIVKDIINQLLIEDFRLTIFSLSSMI